MKRFLVILLAALLLLSFTSCNQDKIDELEAQVKQEEAKVEQEKADHEATIKNFEDFMEAFVLTSDLLSTSYGKDGALANNTGEMDFASLDLTTDANKITFGAAFIERFVELKDGEYIIGSEYSPSTGSTTTYSAPKATKATGKIKVEVEVTTSSQTRTLEFDNVSFKVDYAIKTGSGKDDVKSATLETLTLSGKLVYSLSGSEEIQRITVSFKGTVNGTAYDVSLTATNENGPVECTAAKVNGNDVERRLINAANLI